MTPKTILARALLTGLGAVCGYLALNVSGLGLDPATASSAGAILSAVAQAFHAAATGNHDATS